MPRICTVCTNPAADEINKALAAGRPMRQLAALYRVSADAMERHRADHLPASLVKSKEAQDEARATDVWKELRALRSKAVSILVQAEQQGDLRTALMGIREARACLEVLAELEGELNRNPQVNILVAPEWLTIRAAITDTLRSYPEARVAVAQRLIELEGESRASL
jgi:hypothetical protein